MPRKMRSPATVSAANSEDLESFSRCTDSRFCNGLMIGPIAKPRSGTPMTTRSPRVGDEVIRIIETKIKETIAPVKRGIKS